MCYAYLTIIFQCTNIICLAFSVKTEVEYSRPCFMIQALLCSKVTSPERQNTLKSIFEVVKYIRCYLSVYWCIARPLIVKIQVSRNKTQKCANEDVP